MVNLRKENAELKKVVTEQAKVILALSSRIAQLEKTSRNSSKPPSSDIVKPQSDGKESPRKIGAQPGYQPQQREPFPPKILQQIEFVERPYIITEHKTYTYWCELLSNCKRSRIVFHHEERKEFCRDARPCVSTLFLKTVQRSVPEDKDCQNIAKRFIGFANEYSLFIDADIPPTNNLAEQTIRGVLQTCQQQERSVMEFLQSCVANVLVGLPAPALLK